MHPILGSLFGNELNVGEGSLSPEDIRSGFKDSRSNILDLVLIKNEGLGDCESPAELEGSADHGVRGGGRGRSETVGVIKVHSSHSSGDVDQVDFGEEPREIRGASIVNTVLAANLLVDKPTGHLTIVNCIYQVICTDDITTSEDVWLGSVLHCLPVDH